MAHTVIPFSIEKKLAADGADFNKHVRLMNSLMEVDVSNIRAQTTKSVSPGKKKISMLACLLYCYGQTLKKNPEALAMKSSGNKLFLFDDADAFFPFEIKKEGGGKMLWHKVIRSIDNKSPLELEEEIRAMAGMTKKITQAEKFFFAFPKWARNIFYAIMMGSPILRKQQAGNVYFSSTIHSSCNMLAYGVPAHFHTTGLFVGTYKYKPEDGGGKGATLLPITLSLDHTIGDGPLLAKLCREFKYQVDHFTL